MVFFSLATNSEHQHSTGDHLRCRVRWLGQNFQRVMVVTLMMFATCSSSAVLAVDTDGSPAGTVTDASGSAGSLLGYARLREGTLVPSTVGTIVSLGPRRWAFVTAEKPKLGNGTKVTESESLKIIVTQQNGTTTRRVDSLTLSVDSSQKSFGVGRTRGLLNEDALNASGEQKGKQDDGTHLVLIAENLMLQRIVEAIREDELDTSWEVTGKVTEYFDENRLTIITAQRAESKDLMPSPTR
jgi:hypothetical protein